MTNFVLTFSAFGFLLFVMFSVNSYTHDTVYIYSDSSYTRDDSLKKAEDMSAGKKLYSKRCQKCHTLYKPKDFTEKVWKDNLKEMKEKAGLSDSDYYYISIYLFENARKRR